MKDELSRLGWKEFFAIQVTGEADIGQFGRVVEEHKGMYRVHTESGVIWAEIARRLLHGTRLGDLPAVGDWVTLREPAGEERAVIERVLERFSKFSRALAGKHLDEQVVATNIDVAFMVTSLNGDLNLRRIERYLTGIWASGATPVILLSKADLCPDAVERQNQVRSVAPGVDVVLLATFEDKGVDTVLSYLAAGKTGVLLGSSGVGKSTLFNKLAGTEVQETGEVRADDDRGRHITRFRKLYFLPQGGLLIDTPGMRELMVWDAERGLEQAFADLFALFSQCRFSDCSHGPEPECAVRSAIESGQLDRARYSNYLKLLEEGQSLSKPKRTARPGARPRRH